MFDSHVSLCIALGALLVASPSALAAQQEDVQKPATSIPNTSSVRVDGSPISNITSSPLSLSPAFSPTITDYVWRCQSGANTIQLTLAALPGRTLTVGRARAASLTITTTLLENEALIISANNPPDRERAIQMGDSNFQDVRRGQYWIRCLPHDFPELSVTRPGNPPPGWYLTGSITSLAGAGTYAMILDSNGTPVWYRKPASPNPLDVTQIAGGTIAWKSNSLDTGFGTDPNGAFEAFNLASRGTRWLAAPTPPTDFHELLPMSRGHLMFLSTPLTANVDLSTLGRGSSVTIVDCLLQEVDASGQLVWQWRASDHLSVAESTVAAFGVVVGGQIAYDIFHCNSMDTDSTSSKVLLSTRHTDAVYLIDKATGRVLWKMGGQPFNGDNAQILAITNDPEGTFHNQHDARFEPNGDVSLYDNQSSHLNLAARGVEYHVDTGTGTATLVWSYASPDGHNSIATGSFRRLHGGNDNVIGWGVKANTLFTEVDAAGNVLLDVTFPSQVFAYRVIKVNYTALDHALLRATAGLPPAASH